MVRRQAAAGNDAVQMRVMEQILPPGMKNGEEADAGAQMRRVAGNGEQRFGGRMEQDVVNRLLVVEGDLGDLLGDRENDVEILTLIAAIRVTLSPDKVCVSLRQWSANLDGPHDAQLLQGKLVIFPVSRAVLSKNAGHFESGPRHPGLFPGLLFRLDPECVERTGGGRDHVRRDHRVTRGSVDSSVASSTWMTRVSVPSTTGAAAAVTLSPDKSSICSLLAKKMRGERMAERVGGNAFGQAALL
jgi:hypothetical protein